MARFRVHYLDDNDEVQTKEQPASQPEEAVQRTLDDRSRLVCLEKRTDKGWQLLEGERPAHIEADDAVDESTARTESATNASNPAFAVAFIVAMIAVPLVVYLIIQSQDPSQQLQSASERCLWAEYDGNNDVLHADYNVGILSDISLGELNCVLDKLDAPDYLRRDIERVRAIDGTQHESWGNFSASYRFDGDRLTLRVRTQ